MSLSNLTPEQTKRATNKLIQWIEVDRRIVTYREVAREIRCDINTSKNILSSHLASHPSLFPTYLITGILNPPTSTSDKMDVDLPVSQQTNGTDEDERMKKDEITGLAIEPIVDEEVVHRAMWLVGGDKVESKASSFIPETLTTQLYSLSPSRISDPAHYLPCTTRLRSYPKYYDSAIYGTLRGDFELALTEKRGESSKSTLKSSTTSKPGFAATVVKEPKPAQSVKSMFGNVAAANTLKKEKEEAAVAVVDAKLKGKVKVKSEKGDLQSGGKKSGKRVVHSEDEEEEEEELEEPVPPKKASKPAQIRSSTSKLPIAPTADEERLAMEAVFAMSDDIGKSSDPLGGDAMDVDEKPDVLTNIIPQKRHSTSGADADADVTSVKSGRIRKKRRVVRQVASTDAKGYMVLDDVSSAESYSSDESSAPAPAKSKKTKPLDADPSSKTKLSIGSSTTKKPAVPKKAGQQSLFGYMKKK